MTVFTHLRERYDMQGHAWDVSVLGENAWIARFVILSLGFVAVRMTYCVIVLYSYCSRRSFVATHAFSAYFR